MLVHDNQNIVLTIRFSSAIRKKIWASSGYRCWYCGITPPEDEMTIDHFIPKSSGGGGGRNLVPSCMNCNSTKGSMDIEEFRKVQIKRVRQMPQTSPFRRNHQFAFEINGWRRHG